MCKYADEDLLVEILDHLELPPELEHVEIVVEQFEGHGRAETVCALDDYLEAREEIVEVEGFG
jgi:hypothetical protein